MGFWTAVAVIAVFAGLTVALGFLRGRGPETDEAADDLKVYRDQLREVERDLARGVIAAGDAERLRLEISRRILDADRARARAPARAATPWAVRWAGLATVPVAVLAAVGIYAAVGTPGLRDLPIEVRLAEAREARANRPAQAVAESEMAARLAVDGQAPLSAQVDVSDEERALVQRLRDVMVDRPDDLEGQRLLAASEAALGEFAAAHRAQNRVIELLGDAATVEDYVALADLMILAAGGYVSPEAEVALETALRREPTNPLARYFIGVMMAQNDRPDLAFRLWQQLLEEGPPDAPWIGPIRSQIEFTAMRAGVNYTLPPAGRAGAAGGPGPTDDDIAAAAEMDPEARAAMVEGMIASLSQRLATQGGSAEEWARLIAAYGVIGRAEEARAIWTEAQAVFGAVPDQLAVIAAAAREAGVAQ